MASTDYDSGIGGKFRKRPFRRPSTTPYDRPQTAIRRTTPNPNLNGWISKIVDPASRIIYRGASKLFSSVFQKRLTAPPQIQEENGISRHEVMDAVQNPQKLSDEALEPNGNSGDNAANNCGVDVTWQETPCTKGFFELEQLLRKKTFTRAEFDHLTDLLRSRTVEPSASNLQIGNETEAVVTEQAKHNQEEPRTSQPVVTYERAENTRISDQDRIKSLIFHGNISNSVDRLHVDVPPEEIAKAYMDSRPSKVSPTTLSVRSQIPQDDFTLPTASYAKRSMALPDSRCSIPFPGSCEHSENGYITPRPRGRSALYKMSRSPYFKVHTAINTGGGFPARDGLALSSSSQSSKVVLSGSRQVWKRGSSFLDNDFGSFGPIRRTCQKSLLMFPSQRDLSPSRTSLGQDAGNGNSTNHFSTFGHVPAQSTEMAMKIFEELGKLVPSPSEKLSEKKGSGNANVASDSPLPSLRRSISPKQNIKENEPSQNAAETVVAVVKSTCEGGVGNSDTSATEVKFGREIADVPVSFSAAPSQQEPAVKMTMVQESFELDADKKGRTRSDKLREKSLASSSNSVHSTSMLKGKAVVKGLDRPANEKRVKFMPSGEVSPVFRPSSIPPLLPPSVSEGSPSATTTAAVIEGSGSDMGGRTQKGVDVKNSFGNATSSGLSTSSVPFNFGASTSRNQISGSLTSASSAFPVSAITTNSTATSSSSSIAATGPIFTSTPSSSATNPVNDIFGFSTSEQSSSQSLSSAQNNISTSNSVSSGTAASVFGAQPTQLGSGTASFLHNSAVQFPSFASVPAIGLNGTSLLSSGFSSSSCAPTAAAATNLLSLSSQPPSSTSTTFKSNPFLQSTGFSFGSTTSTSTSLSSSVASTGAVFSFSSVSTTTSSASRLPAQPMFGMQQTQTTGLSSGTAGNDHMNVEYCMTDDNIQASAPSVPMFGQQSNSLSTSSFHFGNATASLGGPPAFQFGNPQNSIVSQNPSPFQTAATFAFSAGGSLGSTDRDKSGRKIVRVKRGKRPKK